MEGQGPIVTDAWRRRRLHWHCSTIEAHPDVAVDHAQAAPHAGRGTGLILRLDATRLAHLYAAAVPPGACARHRPAPDAAGPVMPGHDTELT